MKFPKHISITIEHNDHAKVYETAEQWISERDENLPTFPSEKEKQLCISQNELWTMQWYPNTPVGFVWIAAASFEALMEFADTFE